MRNEEPIVTVVMITYGHEKYIHEAIKGVFMQQTDFPVELIIANDCSPDSTDEVVENLLSQAPENVNIKYTRHESNLGMMPNFIWALQQAKGKYIALCEGDDYWTDPLKLQKQVDFLEENKEYVLVCTNAENTPQEKEDKEINVFDILQYNPIKTLTTMFRRPVLKSFKPKDRMMGDLQLWLHLVKFGKIRFIKDSTAYYRVLEDSASGRNNLTKQIDFLIDRVVTTKENICDFEFTNKQRKKILQDQYSVLIMKALKKSKKLAFKFYIESITSSGQLNLLDLKILKNFW